MSAKTRQAARKAAAAGTGGPVAAAALVRSLDPTDAVQAVQIGQTLLVQRQTMPRGTFETWLRSELGWCRFTAARFIRAAEVYGESVDMVRGWTQALLFALSIRSLPAGLREIIEAQISRGEHFTKRDVEELRRTVIQESGNGAE